ncbi:MAG: hypothetical protein ED556_02255 [Winogradskyella sp.]|uniref:MbnP family protein n=1 Tax=Winogradskyella sp. TaxID=1883156 RepID=UPI000F412BEE|nr:MbnP family protein [Winogradskyella sp.]RNC88032.1 MAG: hypothetical protein ED556_02255 [Winogradskyella sp.]
MKKFLTLLLVVFVCTNCSDDVDDIVNATQINPVFSFTHNWEGIPVTNANFNSVQYTNANGEMLSIERLRYVISDIVFTTTSNEVLELDAYNLVDVTNNNNLVFQVPFTIPIGNYNNVSFTFGFDNEDNSENYADLNSASFNVPDMLGGGYHYMQFDGKYLDASNSEAPFNYHAIRAVDNPGMSPTFPQDTFFTVNLGAVNITGETTFNIEVNLAEWFQNPNTWDLNQLNTVLMPNSAAQIQMFQNGQSVFSLGSVSQQ